MRKSNKNQFYDQRAVQRNENKLWREMMKNLKIFSETSSELINIMPDKLGIPPETFSLQTPCDPCEILNQLQTNLPHMDFDKSSYDLHCNCTPVEELNKSTSNEDLASITYYKKPKTFKRKTHKYSSSIEKKIMSSKQQEIQICSCQGGLENDAVDTCLCNNLPTEVIARAECSEKYCPISLCSYLKPTNIKNIKCSSENEEFHHIIAEDPVTNVLKPGSFDPDGNNMMSNNEDCDDNFIIKTFGVPEVSTYGLGYELFDAMKRFRHRIAQYIPDTDEEQTYESLLEDCIRVAINLQANEYTEDDIVGLSVGNLKESCVPYIAALFLGMKVIAFDTSLSVSDRVHLLHIVTPKIMFVDQTVLSSVEESIQLAEIDLKLVVIGDESDDHALFADYLKASEEDIANFEPIKLKSNKETAVILFSSGTTGLPKGICLSHYGLICQGLILALSGILGNCRTPVTMTFTQLYWISSVVLLITNIVSGVARVVMRNFEPDNIWHLIEKYKLSLIFLSPYQCHELWKSEKPEGINTSSLHVLATGGGAVLDKFIYGLRDILPGTFILQIYGQTEVCGASTLFQTRKIDDQLLLHYNIRSVGRPMAGFWHKVVDTDTGKTLGPNQRGELRIKSAFVMNGYYGRECSEAFDEDGWFKTGDVVYYDEYQCFYVVDRIKEMLKFRGWHIQPAMLENILVTHPAVKRAVVVGLPHDEDGDHPVGLVILNEEYEDTDPEEIALFVEEKVQDRQRLRGGVKIIDHIPLTNTGKIKRQALRQQLINGEI